MLLTLHTFGITRDILGGRVVSIEIDGGSVMDLRRGLIRNFPAIGELNSVMIAVNHSYADDDLLLSELDEIALIPPVSGG